MDDPSNAMAQQQKLLLQQQQQQQVLLLQQYQQQQLQQQQQRQRQQLMQQQQQQQQERMQQQHRQYVQQQQQQAMSRFPSNIDVHLRAPGLRSLNLQQQPQTTTSTPPPQSVHLQPPAESQPQHQKIQMRQQTAHQLQQQQQQKVGATAVGRQGSQAEVEMAQQDARKVCSPDVKRPFSSVEDAVCRLLPYHVVADYETEEDERMLDSDTTGQMPSRLQQWDHNILSKIGEFTNTFEKQILAFNIMSRKRAQGEFRSEERLMLEQVLLREEDRALRQIKVEIESREKANQEAAEAAKMQMAMVRAEQARVEAQASHAKMIAQAPLRADASGHHAREISGYNLGQEHGGNTDEGIQGWGNTQEVEEDPAEEFLNDENEPENGEAGAHVWREVGGLDLNTR